MKKAFSSLTRRSRVAIGITSRWISKASNGHRFATAQLLATSFLIIGSRAHADPSAKHSQRAHLRTPAAITQAKQIVPGSTPPAEARSETSRAGALQALFSTADRNADGSVSFAEFAAVTNDSIARRVVTRFRQLDRNRDGRCTRAEVNKMSAARFARLDLDQDGAFTATELTKAMLKQLGGRLAQLCRTLDRDHDGRFSLAELAPALKQALPKLAKQKTAVQKAPSMTATVAGRSASGVQ